MVMGGVSALIGILLFLRTRRFLGSAISVEGFVKQMQAKSRQKGGIVFRPVVQFTTAEGETMTFTDSVGQNPPRYTPGDTVKVSYPPGKPGKARIPGWFRLWYLPSFSAVFAVIFIGVGIFLSGSTQDTSPVSLPEGGVATAPGGVPGSDNSGALTGPALVIGDGSGAPSPRVTTCESVRDRGQDREVRLVFNGGALTFRASPFTGPGPYTGGANLEVGGSLFDKSASATGAIIFDNTGQSGTVNLTSGNTLANGPWDCTDLKVSR